MTSQLLMLVILAVLIHSSQALRCYQCRNCDQPTTDTCTGDVCLTLTYPGGGEFDACITVFMTYSSLSRSHGSVRVVRIRCKQQNNNTASFIGRFYTVDYHNGRNQTI